MTLYFRKLLNMEAKCQMFPKTMTNIYMAIEKYADKDFSFTDCTSFAIMEELGLTHAVAFDKHFTQYGFVVVP